MENSVESYISAQPETVLSKDEYWQQNYAGKLDGAVKNPAHYNDWDYKIAKFFGGRAVSRFESEYEAYLNNVNNRNEQIATQNANGYQKWLDDTKYQRMFKDFEKAGLNPYLLVNNGSFSASTPTSAKADYKAKSSGEQKRDNGRNMALLFLALARVAAAIL